MADNNLRSYRNRDSYGSGDADLGGHDAASDPLVELARLIGQGDPVGDFSQQQNGHAAPGPEAAPEGAIDWAADESYADDHRYADSRHPAPPAAADDAYPSNSGYAQHARDFDEEPAASRDYAPPPRGADFDAGRDYAPAREDRYRDDRYQDDRSRNGRDTRDQMDRQPAPFQNPPGDHRYESNERRYDAGNGRDYAPDDDYYDDAPSSGRRSGFVLIAAVLCLAVLGTAGAFAADHRRRQQPEQSSARAECRPQSNDTARWQHGKAGVSRGAPGRHAGAVESRAASDHFDYSDRPGR
jgi:hypothetical protein